MTEVAYRLDVGRLERYLRDGALPDVGTLSAVLVEGGRSNLTYALSDGQNRWVLRRPPLGTVAPSANDMHREFTVTSALVDSAVPVARPVHYCTDASVIGAEFSVAEWVDGIVFRDPAQLAALPDAAVRRIGQDLVGLLLTVHAVDHRRIGLEGWGRPEGYLARQVSRWKRQWDIVSTGDQPAADLLQQELALAVPAQSPSGLVHGDFRLDNVIVQTDLTGPAALVDWEMATIGDPLADLGLLLVYCDPISSAVLPHGSPTGAAAAFPTRDELVAAYGRGTDRDLTSLRFYEALGYYKLAVVAEGIHRRYLEGMTVGSGFESVGSAVPGLIRAGRDVLSRGV